MAVNLVSPGVKIREVDLTLGRIDQANDQIAAFAGPFEKGPVNTPILIQSEQQLAQVFGKPRTENNQNAYWLTASNYLSYGGIMQIVRVDSSNTNAMENSYVGFGSTAHVKIKSVEDYNNKTDDALNNFLYCAKNPGAWANDLVVYTIDAAADQIISGINTTATTTTTTTTQFVGVISDIQGSVVGGATSITGISTSGVQVGSVVQCDTTGVISNGTTVTGIGSSTITISAGISTGVVSGTFTFDFGSIVTGVTTVTTGINIEVGYGVSVSLQNREFAGLGVTGEFTGYLKGIITGVGNSSVEVKLISKHNTVTGTSEFIEYVENNPLYSIQSGDAVRIVNPSTSGFISTYTSYQLSDWYNSQTVQLGNSTVYWKNIAERPSTSEFTLLSGGKNDEFNLIVVDSNGKVNGNIGEVLEKFTKLSKASDGKISPAQGIYYKDYLRDNSNYLFVGTHETGESIRFAGINNYSEYSGGGLGGASSGRYFDSIGNKKYTFAYGTDYSTGNLVYGTNLSDITNAYSVFQSVESYPVNFIITGPSGGTSVYESQAKANYIISLAESRKDCIAVVSAHENDVVNQTNSTTQTDNIIKFFNGVTASTYAVFDAGYKYTYDRINNRFLYMACNSDVAGLMAKASINQYPWISPAGATRGVLNNAIKLAYNPTEAQRDLLYTNKINPIISSRGQGIILYGDKTASANVSAFDRINVRRLFLTIEKTIESAAKSQLFEFNDPITRNNFINIVEPYLRDVKSKRGITDFLLICDESNNTPDIIDSNQFRADIYVKPARVINFIGITFVATRTGVSFTEIVGTV